MVVEGSDTVTTAPNKLGVSGGLVKSIGWPTLVAIFVWSLFSLVRFSREDGKHGLLSFSDSCVASRFFAV